MVLWLACVPKLHTVDAGHTRVPILEQVPVDTMPQAGAVVTGNDADDIAVGVFWSGPMTRFHPSMVNAAAESRGFQVLGEPEPEVIFGHEGAHVWVIVNGLAGVLSGWLCPETQRLYTHLVLSDRVWTSGRVTTKALDLVECHGHGEVAWRTVDAKAPDGWTLESVDLPGWEGWRRPDDRELLHVQLHYGPFALSECEALGEVWLTAYGQRSGMELFESEVHRDGDACMASALLPGFWEGGRVRMRIEECDPDELLVVFHTSVMGEESSELLYDPTCGASGPSEVPHP